MTTREIEPFGYVSKAAADTLRDGLSAAIFPNRDGYSSIALYAEPVALKALDAGCATGVDETPFAWVRMGRKKWFWRYSPPTAQSGDGWYPVYRSHAPALARPVSPEVKGEPVAWQWSDFSGRWYTVDTARLSLAEQEELARAIAKDHEGRVRPLYANPPVDSGGLREALTGLLDHYVALVNCGDCGNWNPETEPEVAAARAALKGEPNAR